MKPSARLALRGKIVLVVGGGLSADDDVAGDVGADGLSEDELDIRIEEAALALARAVFVRGGRLAFRDDPVFTPLFIEVALEFWEALPAEEAPGDGERRRATAAPLVVVGASQQGGARETMEWAARIGCLEAASEEAFAGREPHLVIVIGGSPAAEEELDRFTGPRSRGVPVVAMPSTGGAALRAGRRDGVADAEASVVRMGGGEPFWEPPREFGERPQELGLDRARDEAEPARVPDFRYAHYPLVISALFDRDDRESPAR